MNTELLTRVRRINPATSNDAIPPRVWGAQQLLEELERRTETPVPQRSRPNRPWLIAAAVAVLVLVLIGGLGVLGSNRGTDAPPVINQPEPTPTTVLETPPSTVPESASSITTALRGTVNRGLEVSWREVDWALSSVHFTGPYLAGSGVLFRSDRDGSLLRSGDGETWEPVLTDLTDVSLAVDGPIAVAAGTRDDGTSALLVSDEGESWSEIARHLPTVLGLEVLHRT